MAGYRQSNPDRAKAAAATLLVHVAIGAAFLTGLVTQVSRHPSDVLATFDFEPPPPPVVEVKPEESAPKGDPGEAGKKAEPTPVVVPKPKIDVPAKPPVARRSGSRSGRGAISRSGTGRDRHRRRRHWLGPRRRRDRRIGAGFTPATPDHARSPTANIAAFRPSGIRNGSAALRLHRQSGRPGGPTAACIRTSGDATVDALVCQLTQQHGALSAGARCRRAGRVLGHHLGALLVARRASGPRPGSCPAIARSSRSRP